MKLSSCFYLSFAFGLMMSFGVQASDIIDKNYLKLEQPDKAQVKTYVTFLAAAREGNTKALESLFKLSQKALHPYHRSKLTYDLFAVYNAKPYFYVETADKYFKNEICAYTSLITETGENEMYQLEYVLKRGSDVEKSNKIMTRFMKYNALKPDALKSQRKACL